MDNTKVSVTITAPVFGKLVGVRTLKEIASGLMIDPYARKPGVVTMPMVGAAGKAATPGK